MTDTLGQIAITAAAGIIGPAITAVVAYWVFSKKQKLDWDRQDKVAVKVSEAKKATDLVAEKLEESTKGTNGKLDVIHDLVNSKMTESMQNELDATEMHLASLKEIVRLHKASGRKPSKGSTGIIKATEERIAELKARMQDRVKQQDEINARK